MTDEPTCPGVGPYLNQPAVLVVAGTITCPFANKPSSPTLVVTPIEGIESVRGTDDATRTELMSVVRVVTGATVETGVEVKTMDFGLLAGTKVLASNPSPTMRTTRAVVHHITSDFERRLRPSRDIRIVQSPTTT
jgi:hypothetical protein